MPFSARQLATTHYLRGLVHGKGVKQGAYLDVFPGHIRSHLA
jgi:hypothetical protein